MTEYEEEEHFQPALRKGEAMFCTKCGVESPADSQFCSKCGQEMATEAAAVAPQPDTSTPTSEAKPKPKKKANWVLRIILAVIWFFVAVPLAKFGFFVSLLIAVAAVAYMVGKLKKANGALVALTVYMVFMAMLAGISWAAQLDLAEANANRDSLMALAKEQAGQGDHQAAVATLLEFKKIELAGGNESLWLVALLDSAVLGDHKQGKDLARDVFVARLDRAELEAFVDSGRVPNRYQTSNNRVRDAMTNLAGVAAVARLKEIKGEEAAKEELDREERIAVPNAAIEEATKVVEDEGLCDTPKAIADAWKKLSQVRKNDGVDKKAAAVAKKLERCRSNVDQALRKGLREVMAGQRVKVADRMESNFLDKGIDATVTVTGKNKDRLTIKWALMSRVAVHQLTAGRSMNKGALLRNLQDGGYTRVTFSDGFKFTTYFDLKPSEATGSVLDPLGLGEPLRWPVPE